MFKNYQEFLEHIYYNCIEEAEKIEVELNRHHKHGVDNMGTDNFFFLLTEKLSLIHDSKDMVNAIMVACATLIYDTGILVCDSNPEKIMEVFGIYAHDFYNSVLRKFKFPGSIRKRPLNPVTQNELIRLVSLVSPEKLKLSTEKFDVHPHIELLNNLKGKIGDVEATCMVAIQHLFGSTVSLLEEICNPNIPRKSAFILGKPYSTNHASMWYLRNDLKYNVHHGSSDYLGTKEYHVEADKHIEEVLNRAIVDCLASGPKDRSILLLDDGGRAIKKLHEHPFSKFSSYFVAVEQTRKGISEISGIDLRIPVINVAESWAKLQYESPLIAESVKDELLKQLDRLKNAGISIGKSCLIIGYGAIGRSVARALRSLGINIHIFDKEKSKIEQTTNDNFKVAMSINHILPEMDIVIGCTGYTVLDDGNFHLLKEGALLVSTSSSDVEFSAWKLRSLSAKINKGDRYLDKFNLLHHKYKGKSIYLGDEDHPCHSLFAVPINGKTIFLVNGGFPVNFNGEVDPIHPSKISLTRGLLLCGCIQASNTKEKGIHKLHDVFQNHLIDEFSKEVIGM